MASCVLPPLEVGETEVVGEFKSCYRIWKTKRRS